MCKRCEKGRLKMCMTLCFYVSTFFYDFCFSSLAVECVGNESLDTIYIHVKVVLLMLFYCNTFLSLLVECRDSPQSMRVFETL
jgi:hypothetical protein